MPAASIAVGRIVATETEVIFTPRGGCSGRRPVFLFHGQNRTALDWNDTATQPGATRIAWTLAAQGLVVIAAYWTGSAWGNAAFRASVETARTYAATLGAASDKFIAVGASHGAFECLSLASHVPTEVACGVVLVPAVDLDYFRDTDVGGNSRNNINTAYGLAAGSTSATVPLPSDANVALDANAALITAPFKFYGSSSDTTAPWSQATTLAGKIGATTSDVSNQGHSDATIAAAPVSEITAFVMAHV